MNDRRLRLIRIAYWIGIVVDGLWVVGLFIPSVYGLLSGNAAFAPDIETRLVMGIAGSLMAGWTLLLAWGLRRPIERRGVLLLTAFPVVSGIHAVSLLGYLQSGGQIWIVLKTFLVLVLMITSYIRATRVARQLRYA